MMQLADEVRARGGTPREPLDYKQQYHDMLWQHVGQRVAALKNLAATPEQMSVPGAHRLLEKLAARGLTLYLASGTDLTYVRDELAALAMDRYFGEHVYGALDDYKNFSKAMIIDRIIGDMGVRGEAAVGLRRRLRGDRGNATRGGRGRGRGQRGRDRARASTPGSATG